MLLVCVSAAASAVVLLNQNIREKDDPVGAGHIYLISTDKHRGFRMPTHLKTCPQTQMDKFVPDDPANVLQRALL